MGDAPLLDPAVGLDAHAGERLATEPVIWLGTVAPDGRPHTVPVWFTWADPVVDRLVVWRSTPGGLEYRSLPSPG